MPAAHSSVAPKYIPGRQGPPYRRLATNGGEKCRLENASFSSVGERVSSTINVGISCFSDKLQNGFDIMADKLQNGFDIMADANEKLYESKRKGKNSVSH